MTTGLEQSGDRLGRYVIERRLAVGGMAELFLARLDGPEAFSKKVVIKRILPRIQHDELFTKMFLDEARLAARFSHQNLVQAFELAEVDGQPILVMEYIDGKDLAALLSFAQGENQSVPIRIAAYLVGQIAQGLHAAHELTGDRGEKLNVVHRDISPENVLMTRQGGVKVIDFGIAKHEEQHTKTVAGTVKGKVAYMSPEQLLRKPLDRRSDVFSLGVVFYELIAGVQCFKGDFALQQMMAVEKAEYEPVRSLRPKVPPDVEAVVDRMLALHPRDRFQNGRQVVQAIERLMAKYGTVLPGDLEAYIAPMFDEGSEKARRDRDGSIAEDAGWESEVLAIRDETVSVSEAMPMQEEITVPRNPAKRGRTGTPVFIAPEQLERMFPNGPGGSSTARKWLPVALGLGAVTLVWFLAASILYSGTAEIRSIPPGALIHLDGEELGRTPLVVDGLRTGAEYALSVKLSGYSDVERSFTPETGADTETIRLEQAAPVGAAVLTVLTEPSGALIKVVGRGGGKLSPGRFVLPAGQSHRFSAELKGFAPASLDIQLREGEQLERRIVLVSGIARLWLESAPAVTVYLGDRRLGETPIEGLEVPVGPGRILLRNRQLGIERVMEMDFGPGEKVSKSVSFSKGQLRFAAEPSAVVFVDGTELGSTPLAPIAAYEGVHEVRFVNRGLNKDVTRTIELQAGQSVLVDPGWN